MRYGGCENIIYTLKKVSYTIHTYISPLSYLVTNLLAIFKGSCPIFREPKIKKMRSGILPELLLLLGEIGATNVTDDALFLQLL